MASSSSADPPPVEAEQPSQLSANIPSRNAFSKYDFVKVKVWLGENADHYYVLSRFLLCRMLTVTKIPNHVAIKIALELKKLLVDNSLLDVSQMDLEANLFKLMERRGYGMEYINRYKMMTRFHHQRVPLVILVCGTACTGKSTIATQLAQRLNLPNVLQTEMVYELLRTSTEAPLVSTPVWARDFKSPEELITEFCRECRVVRKGLAGDLKKAMKDGKPIIIEGIHLDPSIYLMDEGKGDGLQTNGKIKECGNSDDGANTEDIADGGVNIILDGPEYHFDQGETENHFDQGVGGVSEVFPGKDISESSLRVDEKSKGEMPVDSDSRSLANSKEGDIPINSDSQSLANSKEGKISPEPIIVPIVLKMSEFDHKALLEEWISTRNFGDKSLLQDHQKLMKNLKVIQEYLCSFKSQGLTIVDISADTFPQTLDWLHGYLLQCIERGLAAAQSEACDQRSNATS